MASDNFTIFIYNVYVKDFFDCLIAYKIYQVLSASALVAGFLAACYLFILDGFIYNYTTAKIIGISHQVTKLILSSLAFTLTLLLINYNYSLTAWSIIYLNGLIMVTVMELRFFPLLIIVDMVLRTRHCISYGDSAISIIFTFAMITFTATVSILGGYIIFFTPGLYYYFVTILLVLMVVMQLLNTLLTLYLKCVVKKMRQRSVLSSSLTERHECSKNLEFLRHILPETIISLVCGMMSLCGTLISVYIIPTSPYVAFVINYGCYEVASLAASSLELSFWAKKKFAKKTNMVHASTRKIPIQTMDEHFDSLKQMWDA